MARCGFRTTTHIPRTDAGLCTSRESAVGDCAWTRSTRLRRRHARRRRIHDDSEAIRSDGALGPRKSRIPPGTMTAPTRRLRPHAREEPRSMRHLRFPSPAIAPRSPLAATAPATSVGPLAFMLVGALTLAGCAAPARRRSSSSRSPRPIFAGRSFGRCTTARRSDGLVRRVSPPGLSGSAAEQRASSAVARGFEAQSAQSWRLPRWRVPRT
jgi:hypothetical protein